MSLIAVQRFDPQRLRLRLPMHVYTRRFSMNTISKVSVDEIVEMTQLRPFPATASRLLSASKSPSTTMMEMTEIITHDPALSMQILKLANSSTYGMTAQISSIQHAGVIIGLSALKNLAISMLVGDMFEAGESKTDAARKALFDHSLLTACLSKHISRAIPSASSETAFLGGMLHDIGKLLLADYRPSEFAGAMSLSTRGESVVGELKTFGIDHVTVGESYCETWGLPGEMIDIVADHHRSGESMSSRELQAVVAANMLSGEWQDTDQEELDAALNTCPDYVPGTLTVETLKESVQEELDVITEIRASR